MQSCNGFNIILWIYFWRSLEVPSHGEFSLVHDVLSDSRCLIVFRLISPFLVWPVCNPWLIQHIFHVAIWCCLQIWLVYLLYQLWTWWTVLIFEYLLVCKVDLYMTHSLAFNVFDWTWWFLHLNRLDFFVHIPRWVRLNFVLCFFHFHLVGVTA